MANSLKNINFTLIVLVLIIFGYQLNAQETEQEDKKVNFTYGSKGFQMQTRDNRFLLHLESRFQFRFAYPNDEDPLNFDAVISDSPIFKINRARLKVGGNAFAPWLKYYWEYELGQGNLLDFRLMVEKWEFLKFKAGQWKTYYNRERVISSGKQQMMDRSILNRPFTIDRQQGISVYGRIFPKTLTDISYYFSVLTGAGRGSTQNDDSHLMYVGRLQWNFLGRELEMTGSDLDYHEKPTALLAFGALTNRSPYTRFSQSGGGQLNGFEEGIPGQYRVKQALIETAFMYRGFSWQQELHFKDISDKVNETNTELYGNYVQAGYFLNGLWKKIPKPLEVAGRYSFYVPNSTISSFKEEEYALAFNWFFAKHRNKLTTDITYFNIKTTNTDIPKGWRFRVQWDISL
ncbi:porin [uncultured Eudoraea sp.]|uniref:porin n=1 Tax=uncultured Eudoraea sp. TaxID=1035614 RepID=UPI0026188479|nr:porin [uncultured Eudoraea sp.]